MHIITEDANGGDLNQAVNLANDLIKMSKKDMVKNIETYAGLKKYVS